MFRCFPHGAVGCDCGISILTYFLLIYHPVSKIITLNLRWQFISHSNLSAIRYAINDVTTMVLIRFHAPSGADIIWFIVRKRQVIMLAGFQQC